jgi:hypothetical protein
MPRPGCSADYPTISCDPPVDLLIGLSQRFPRSHSKPTIDFSCDADYSIQLMYQLHAMTVTPLSAAQPAGAHRCSDISMRKEACA